MDCRNRAQPFDTLESTQEFMALLQQSISDALGDLEQDLLSTQARAGRSRRAQALELALFKLKQLRSHVFTTERLLKDLRTLRGLLWRDLERNISPVPGEAKDAADHDNRKTRTSEAFTVDMDYVDLLEISR